METNVSNHRKAKKTAGRTCTVATALFASTLLFAPLSAAQDPAIVAVGVGGFRDPGAEHIPAKLDGFAGNFPTYTPIVSQDPLATPFTWSVAKDVPALEQQIRQNAQNGDTSAVITYSRGTLVAAQVQRNFGSDPDNSPDQSAVLFYYIAPPNNPDGGIYSRYPGLPIPGLAFDGALPETKYTTLIVYREYDPYADSPDDILNPLSALNSLLAVRYVHPDQYYDNLSEEDLAVLGETRGGPLNSAGGATVVYRLPSNQLPLLGPVREISALFGTTAFTEPFVRLVEPTLKLGVDLGYDRTNDETVATPATPGSSLLRLPAALPSVVPAVQQGVTNATTVGTGNAPVTTPAITSSTSALDSSDAQSDDQQDEQPSSQVGAQTSGRRQSVDMTDGNLVRPGQGASQANGSRSSDNPVQGALNVVNSVVGGITHAIGSFGKPATTAPRGSTSPSGSSSDTSGTSASSGSSDSQ